MFDIITATLVMAATSVLSLTVNTPIGEVHPAQSLTITWESTPTDSATFDIELFKPSFIIPLALASNVDTSTGEITVTLPLVPAGEYILEFVNRTDINEIFAASGVFSIAPAV
ncbi:hypothetical protein FB451DRAFT_58681 [Mycena latifolia]|nr:hypothetical protein FB451DRAFT_58681 [Mycena latifolia]